jgi:hypothetical protein
MRFAYEEAEGLLDQFAAGPRFAAFRRAYRKFKHVLMSYAFVDYMDGDRLDDAEAIKHAVALAWEDAQMAFVGHGESALTGAVIQLWATLENSEHDLFFETIKEAFLRAERATASTTPRMYLAQYRKKKPRRPEQGFTLRIILPMAGVKLRDWAVDAGKDPDEVEEQWAWLERADRLPDEVKGKPEVKVEPKKGAHLRLVPKDNS